MSNEARFNQILSDYDHPNGMTGAATRLRAFMAELAAYVAQDARLKEAQFTEDTLAWGGSMEGRVRQLQSVTFRGRYWEKLVNDFMASMEIGGDYE